MIKNKTFNIIVEQGSDGYLISSVIELPGCHTQAKTYDELLARTKEAIELYKTFYKDHPFTHVSENKIDLKQVVNTNKCILYLEKHGGKLFIQSVIDNLTKGASGQAVQNMNLVFGLDETTGLKLKPSAF